MIPSEVWSSFCCVLDSWITPGLPQISWTGWQEHTHTLPCGAEKPGTHLASEVLRKPFFNLKTLISSPWVNCKGSDAVMLVKWLVFQLKILLNVPTVDGYNDVLQTHAAAL